jgi:AcrR family transcriptional regulator
MKKTAVPQPRPSPPAEDTRRSRILQATGAVLMEQGYAGANMTEIAARARVSKRELYALFGNKQGLLAALIAGRSAEIRAPLALPLVLDRAELAATLIAFGKTALRELCDPSTTALNRLAAIERERSPEVAQAVDRAGREVVRIALVDLLVRAQSYDLLRPGDPAFMAGQYFSLLLGDLLLRLLLGTVAPPSPKEMAARAKAAAAALLTLHGVPTAE